MQALIESHFPVCIERREGRGRCIIATTDVPAGTTVLRCAAAAVWVTDTSKCSRCISAAGTLVCTACRAVKYCSKACQASDWRQHHKRECKLIPRLLGLFSPPATLDSQQIVDILLAGRLSQCKAEAGAPPLSSSELIPTVTHEWSDILSMEADTTGGTAEALRGLLDTLREWGLLHATTTLEDAAHMLTAFSRNNFLVDDDLLHGRAAAVIPAGALLNHSCVPNCALRYKTTINGVVQEIRTLKPVRAGDELCHSYVEIALPAIARQDRLRCMYDFACTCQLCVRDASCSSSCDAMGDSGAVAGTTTGISVAGGLVGVNPLDRGLVCSRDGTVSVLPASQPAVASLMSVRGRLSSQAAMRLLLSAGGTGGAASVAAARVSLLQDVGIAAEHAHENRALIAAALGALQIVAPPYALPACFVPGKALDAENAAHVQFEIVCAEVAMAELQAHLSPSHMDLMGLTNVLLARYLLVNDLVAAIVAAAHIVDTYRLVYAHSDTHPMIALQLFTLGDLCSELVQLCQIHASSHSPTEPFAFASRQRWARIRQLFAGDGMGVCVSWCADLPTEDVDAMVAALGVIAGAAYRDCKGLLSITHDREDELMKTLCGRLEMLEAVDECST